MRDLRCCGLHGTLLVDNVWQAEIQSQSCLCEDVLD